MDVTTITDNYLRMKDVDTMTQFQRLIVDAKISCGAWKPYRQDYILRDGKPIPKDTLDFLKR